MHRKTPESEFLFNKVAGLQLYQKETPAQLFACECCGNFKNTQFENHLRTVSEFFLQLSLLRAVKFSAVTSSEVFFLCQETITESYSEPCQISKMNCSVKIVNSLRGLRFSVKVPSQMYDRALQRQPPEMFYKVFLEILQNSQENTCARESFFLRILRNF